MFRMLFKRGWCEKMSEERKRILEMVKNGELSVEEAEKLISVLDKIQSEKQQKEQQVANSITADVDFQSESQDQQENKQQSTKNTTESTKEKILNLVESALNKLKDLDLDFHHSVDVTHNTQQNFSDFTKVMIDIPNGSVELVSWDVPDVRAEFNAKVFRTEDSTVGKEKLLENIDFDVRNGQLIVGCNDKIMKVSAKIYIPERLYEKVHVKLFNGSIKGDGLKADVLELKTANGKLDIVNCEGTKAEVETGNGAISITDTTIKDLEVESINGKINVDGSFVKLDVQSLGGTIFATVKNQDADTVRVESATGSVYLKVPNEIGVLGELKSNIGSVQVQLANVQNKEERNEIIQKMVKFEKQGEGDRKVFIFAESKTGSVFVQPL